MTRIKGRVKWFNNDKGYGFLESAEMEAHVFVHYSQLEGNGYKTLEEGDEDEFEVTQSPRGPQAERVRKL